MFSSRQIYRVVFISMKVLRSVHARQQVAAILLCDVAETARFVCTGEFL